MFESCRAHGLTKPFFEVAMQRSGREFVLCPMPPAATRRASRAAREREAKAYWDSLTPEQEAWVLRKMGFHRLGQHGLEDSLRIL